MSELAYVQGVSSTPLYGETIGQAFDRIVAAHSDNEALVARHQGLRYTYRELRTEVDLTARGLIAMGIAKGDRVGIWSPNRAEWAVVQYATAKIGAILVNINPAYRSRELEYALRQSGISLLVAAPRFRDADYAAMIRELVPEIETDRPGEIRSPALPDLSGVVYLGDEPPADEGAWRWEDVRGAAAGTSEDDLAKRGTELDFDEPINIQYTSGTTGFPKGATLSHHNILNNGFFVGECQALTPADRLCLPLPFYHCFGMVLGNLAFMTHGATVVLPGEAFDPLSCLETVEAERCTALYGVPTMFIAELEHPEFDSFRLDSLRTGIMAGAPCPVEVMRRAIDRMNLREVTIAYGMTETSPVSTQSSTTDSLEHRVGTVGSVHPHVEVRIVDPATNRTVRRGEPGELCTRGYVVMLGYWNDPEATRQAIDAGHWMHTGDLAVMLEDGYVNIVGRIKDMIIRGGENVYPREVEEFLYTHPGVADVQVIGVPDPKYGEAVCAWVKLKEGATETQESLREFCRGKIASYKIPSYVRLTDDFPMTVTGKVQKFRMREISTKELGLSTTVATA